MADCREAGPLTEAHIRRGLPHPVGVALRAIGDASSEGAPPLFPGEAEALGSRAVPLRRVLFAQGRAAARAALAQLGLSPVAIGRGDGGQPLWPDGIVGTISHSHHLAVAIVGHSTDYAGLGVDIEELDRGVDARIARLVARPGEMAWLNLEAGLDRLIMLFSAKEAVFKALYPAEHVWFGFADAELTWRAERGAFDAELLKTVGAHYPSGFHLEVPCVVGPTWVASTAFVPR